MGALEPLFEILWHFGQVLQYSATSLVIPGYQNLFRSLAYSRTRPTCPVSQEILSLGKIVAVAKCPRKFCRSNLTERRYFQGNFAAARKFCR